MVQASVLDMPLGFIYDSQHTLLQMMQMLRHLIDLSQTVNIDTHIHYQYSDRIEFLE